MNIDDIILQQGIIYDRFPSQTLTLPYSGFDSIKIQPNETVTNFNINNVITKLYTNFLQLYKYAFIASNVIPITSVATIGVSAGIVSYLRGLSTSQITSFAAAGSGALDNTDVIRVKYNAELDKNIIIASPGKQIYVLKEDSVLYNIDIIASPESNSGPSSWGQIRDMEFGDNNSLFVLDASANYIYRYDASGLLTSDNILANTLFKQAYVGGLGTFDEPSKFNRPVSMTYYNSELYVLDAGNRCIKKYDSNLNWEITYRLFRDFLNVNPIQIEHDNTGNIYVLLDNNIMYRYNNDFTDKIIFDVDPLTGDPSRVIKVTFSPSDNNIFYIITRNFIYKRLVNNPSENIAKYSLRRFGVNTVETIVEFTSLAVEQGGKPYDRNYIFSNSTSVNGLSGKLGIYLDSLDPINILTDVSFDVYPLSSINIHPEEYLQNWVFNKAISKLLINHMRLRDSLDGKFLYQKDRVSGDLVLTDIRYLLPPEVKALYFDQDITRFIGSNEIFQNNIINRPFEYIYNIQVLLLDALNAEIRNYIERTQVVSI